MTQRSLKAGQRKWAVRSAGLAVVCIAVAILTRHQRVVTTGFAVLTILFAFVALLIIGLALISDT